MLKHLERSYPYSTSKGNHMKIQTLTNVSFVRIPIDVAVFLSCLALIGVANAQTSKILFSYFRPTPIVCQPLTSNIWGASGVLPRDKCNGLQDQSSSPQWLYWDGKILRAKDGKYHMFATRWAHSTGHWNWFNSEVIHAVSESSPIGPYVDKGFAYNNGPDMNSPHKGHNVSVVELPDSSYAMLVSEIVPFTIFTSKSLDGPWTNLGHATINTNGVQVKIPFPGDQHLESNVSLVVRPDGYYEIIQRHGIIAISTTGLLGPYNVQKVTNTYPADQQPPSDLATIFPNRRRHTTDDALAPGTVENTNVFAEDPLIWYGGGQYHVLYDYPGDLVGYHLTSRDGIHDWTDQGFAYDPRQAKKLFSYTDGTIVHWYKMERPNIYVENGHIKFFTFAVCDVDKGEITGGSNHSNNVIVMSFDGEAFDKETGVEPPPPRSAFEKIEAENFNMQYGVQTESCSEGGEDIGFIENGDYAVYNNIDFGDGTQSIQIRTSSASSGGSIEIRLDSINGTSAGICQIEVTGDWNTWATGEYTISNISGKHDLYLKFTGNSGFLFNVNWIQFVKDIVPVQKQLSQSIICRYKTVVSNGNIVVTPEGNHHKFTVSIYSSNGRILTNKEAAGETVSIPVTSKGIYLVSICSNGHIERKIISNIRN